MAAVSHAASAPLPPSQHNCSSVSRMRERTRSRGSAGSKSANTTNSRRACLTASAAASTGTLLSKLPAALTIEARALDCFASPLARSQQAWYAAATAAQSLGGREVGEVGEGGQQWRCVRFECCRRALTCRGRHAAAARATTLQEGATREWRQLTEQCRASRRARARGAASGG